MKVRKLNIRVIGLTVSCEFKLGQQQNMFAAWPQRGEMFLAWRTFPYSEAPQERNRFYLCWQSLRYRVSLLRSEIFGCALVAINISLLWSENEFSFLRTLG
jgi:hypothetical protein